jgi:hypothetical protein
MADRYWVGGSGNWSDTARWSTASGGSSGASVPTAADNAIFNASSDSNATITVTLTGASTCLNLDMSVIDQNLTFTGAFTLSVLGNLALSATKTIDVTGITSLALTATTTRTITGNGGTLTGDITFNSTTGIWSLQDTFTITGLITHSAGTIAFNGKTFAARSYTTTTSFTRALNFTTANSILSLNTTLSETIFNITSTSGLTITSPSTGLVDIVGSSNVTRTIAARNLAAASAINFRYSSTAGTITASSNMTVRDLTINCVGTTVSNIAITVYGSFSYTAGTLSAGTNLLTLSTLGGTSNTFTATGGVLDFPITITGGNTGTFTLGSNVTIGSTAARTFTLDQGVLALGSYTLTVYGSFNSTGIAVRTLDFGTGYIDLTLDGSTATTIWDTTTVTNLTITNAATGSIRVKGSGTLTRSINTGGLSEANSLSFEFLSTAGTITLTNTTSRIKNFIINCPGTTVSNAVIACYGNFTYTAGTLAAGANTLTFSATSGTQTISSAGNLDFPITFAGTATYSLSSNVSIGTTTSRLVNLTTGTIELNSYTLTLYGQFNPTGTGTRRIQMSGTGGKIALSLDTTVTVYNNGTVTGFTTDGNVLIQLTGGGATTKTINAGAGTEAQAISFQLSTTAGTVTFTASNTVKNLTIDNNTFTISNIALTIYGNLLLSGTSPTLTAGTNTWTFSATSSKTITTSGKTIDFPLTFSGVAGTWALQDALTVGTSTSRTVTLTTGTLELNSYTFTIFGIFSSSGTSTRKIQMSGTGGKIVLSSAAAATIWDTGTVTNMTTDGNVLVQLTGGGATVKTINSGALSEANSISFQLSTTAGTVTFTASNTVKNLTIDNNTFTISNIALTIYGNLLLSGTSPTLTAGTNTWTFSATSSKTITTSGKTLDFPVTFNGVGGTWALQDALTIGSSRTTTLTAGTLNFNSLTMTVGTFAVTGASAKVFAHGTSGNLVVVASFDSSTGSSLTSTGTGLINMTSGTSKSFNGGGNSFKTLNQGGVGALTIVGNNTFSNITNTVQPCTVTFTSNSTNTFDNFSLSGTLGVSANYVTINSTGATNHTLALTSGSVNVSYLAIYNSTATGGTGWNATNSVDGGNNIGWIIVSAGGSTSSFLIFFFP